jgi:hypothetical protein
LAFLLSRDAQSLHHAHHRHRIPQITAAWRQNVAVGQFLRDLAIWQLPICLGREGALARPLVRYSVGRLP